MWNIENLFHHHKGKIMTIYQNPETKVVFASDDAQAAPITEIQASDIAGYQAQGYTVDSSASSFVTSTSTAATPDTSTTDTTGQTATTSAPVADTSSTVDASTSSSAGTDSAPVTTAPAANDASATPQVGGLTGVPMTPGGVPVVQAQPDAVTVSGAQPYVPDANVQQGAAAGGKDAIIEYLWHLAGIVVEHAKDSAEEHVKDGYDALVAWIKKHI